MGALNILLIPTVQMPAPDAELLARIQAAAGPESTVTIAESRSEAYEAIVEADVILGRIDPELLARARRLKWVHATTAGADRYLFPEMMEHSAVISGDKGLVGSHLADTAMGLLLAVVRRIAIAILDGPASWEKRFEYRKDQLELEGLTMGIVGFSGTGRAIAQRAAGFDMRCIAVDAYDVPGSPPCRRSGASSGWRNSSRSRMWSPRGCRSPRRPVECSTTSGSRSSSAGRSS